MKEGFVIELLDEEAASVGYLGEATFTNNFNQVEIVDDAAFFIDRSDAKTAMKDLLANTNHEPVLRKAIAAIEIAK